MRQREEQIEENGIDLLEMLAVLLDKVWVIILVGVLTAGAAFGYTKFMVTPIYQATTQAYVLTKAEDAAVTSGDISLSNQLLGDCASLLKSRPVTDKVIEELGLKMSSTALANAITVTNQENTLILNISVSNPDPYLAKELADKVRDVGANHVTEVMNLKAMNTVQEALIPSKPASPNIMKNTVFGGAAGVVLTAGIILLIFLMNDKIRSQDDVEKYLGIGVLGAIPSTEDKTKTKKKK